MKTFFTSFIISLSVFTIDTFSQSGTFNFTSNTTNSGSTVTQQVSGVTLTISANNAGNMDLVDAQNDFGLNVSTTAPQALEMTAGSSQVTISFGGTTVNIRTIHCFDGENRTNYNWDFIPIGGSSSSKLNQNINGAAGSTITLNFIGITGITVKLTGGGSGIYFGFDDIVMDASLPVELTSFTGVAYGNIVALDWATATEVNNYGFNVERSIGNRQEATVWERIGFVQGHGNSNSPKEYSFTDNLVLAHNLNLDHLQYRLKQIDFDGKFEYSDIVEVKIETPANFKLAQNFPNPFNPETTINYQLSAASHVTLKVYDILGNEVATLVDESQQAGTYNSTFNALHSSLTSGVYFYTLKTSTGFSATKKLLLVK